MLTFTLQKTSSGNAKMPTRIGSKRMLTFLDLSYAYVTVQKGSAPHYYRVLFKFPIDVFRVVKLDAFRAYASDNARTSTY